MNSYQSLIYIYPVNRWSKNDSKFENIFCWWITFRSNRNRRMRMRGFHINFHFSLILEIMFGTFMRILPSATGEVYKVWFLFQFLSSKDHVLFDLSFRWFNRSIVYIRFFLSLLRWLYRTWWLQRAEVRQIFLWMIHDSKFFRKWYYGLIRDGFRMNMTIQNQ